MTPKQSRINAFMSCFLLILPALAADGPKRLENLDWNRKCTVMSIDRFNNVVGSSKKEFASSEWKSNIAARLSMLENAIKVVRASTRADILAKLGPPDVTTGNSKLDTYSLGAAGSGLSPWSCLEIRYDSNQKPSCFLVHFPSGFAVTPPVVEEYPLAAGS